MFADYTRRSVEGPQSYSQPSNRKHDWTAGSAVFSGRKRPIVRRSICSGMLVEAFLQSLSFISNADRQRSFRTISFLAAPPSISHTRRSATPQPGTGKFRPYAQSDEISGSRAPNERANKIGLSRRLAPYLIGKIPTSIVSVDSDLLRGSHWLWTTWGRPQFHYTADSFGCHKHAGPNRI